MNDSVATLQRPEKRASVATASTPMRSRRWGYPLLGIVGIALVGLALSSAAWYGEWDVALALLPQALYSAGITVVWLAAMFLGGPDPYLEMARRKNEERRS